MRRGLMKRSLGSTVARLLVFVCTAGLLAAATGLSAQASGTTSAVRGRAAKTISLTETGHLTFDPSMERGSAIGERGRAVGTYNAPVECYLTIHAHYVTATVTVYPKGGSITGVAKADYVVTGSVGSFHGTLAITHGTGTYRHISGKMALEGGINHQNYKLWLVAKGSAKY
jgi:hypothetical protein